MAQEKNIGAEWVELAKAAAKAERELNVKAAAEANNEQGENDELRGTMEAGTGAAEGD